MKNSSKAKKFTLAILLVFSAFMTLCISSFAEDKLCPVYFDYWDGVCRDGSVGDKAGIIGDEDDHLDQRHRHDHIMTSSLVVGNNNNINDNVTPKDAINTMARADAATTSSDEENASAVFWGVLISLLVGTALILLVVLMTPKNQRVGKK